jgi:two-component system, chemotaxis family, CheB/CheR fusion protein
MSEMDESVVSAFTVVGIGASAGGIKALKEFFERMPSDTGMAFVVIVHLSQEHESNLAGILQACTAMPVTQVREMVTIEPDHVYVIPPSNHLAMIDGVIKLTEPELIRGKRLPIDLFLRTLAEAHGKNGVAVILSGTGSDGTLGLKRIKENGGMVFVQDPLDAEYDGMPQSAIATKLVDVILPIAELPRKIIAICQFGAKLKIPDGDKNEQEIASESAEGTLREVLALLKIRTGHDFSSYKRPTLLRRVARRLQVHEVDSLSPYLDLLRERPEELQALMRDLLITVTNFFRDKEAFDFLEHHVVPSLFVGKGSNDTIRVWVCGCATGEEAYSIAILLKEYASKIAAAPKIQVFSSDINEEALRTARLGCYSETILADVSGEHLERYFIKESNSYSVKKELREIVLFTPHNILRDQPFSRMDLVSCRNLLIYLKQETQAGIIELFNFALRTGGYLLLGSAESAENFPALFSVVDRKRRIYKCLPLPARHRFPAIPSRVKLEAGNGENESVAYKQPVSFAALHYEALEQFAPPSILVNGENEIVHASERAGRFMHFVGGEPTRDVIKMVHPALQLELRAALMEAKQDNRQTESRHVQVRLENAERQVHLVVRPAEMPRRLQGYFLVIFDEVEQMPSEEPMDVAAETLENDGALESVVQRLEDELVEMRHRLQITVEHSDTSTEELKASNEEFQAINEELRSASEELETSKEELQSLNEELITLNQELREKIKEADAVNADLQNLMRSTEIGIIFLDHGLRIRRYTPRAQELWNVIPSDIGRPFAHLTHKLDYEQLSQDSAAVLRSLQVVEREVRGTTNRRSYLARLAPYRTMDDHIEGIVISFLDVTELKRANDLLRDRELQLRMAQDAAKAGVWSLQLKDGGAWWSDECLRLHGLEPGSVEMNMKNWISRLHPNESTQVEAAIFEAATLHIPYNFETRVSSAAGGERHLMEIGRAVYDQKGEAIQVTGITLDITERVLWREEQSRLFKQKEETEEALRLADRRKDEFLAMLAHELRNPLTPLQHAAEILKLYGAGVEDADKAANIVDRQLRSLARIIDDLLDAARIAQGKIELKKERVELGSLLRNAVQSVRHHFEARQQELEISLPETPIYLKADPIRLEQAFGNLLHNASKYTVAGGHIELSAALDIIGEPEVVVCVRDNGIGIDAETLPQIFELFMQASSSLDRTQGGLGIGLTLVRRIVSLHGGSVTANSEGLGFGAEFAVRLPARPESETAHDHQPQVISQNGNNRILVVDDSVDTVRAMEVILRLQGYQVATATNGAVAIQTAIEFRPEIVILDIGLPDMDGFEVARELRRIPQSANAFLVALTGYGTAQDRELAREAGFDQLLTKPVHPAVLFNFIAQGLALRTARSE